MQYGFLCVIFCYVRSYILHSSEFLYNLYNHVLVLKSPTFNSQYSTFQALVYHFFVLTIHSSQIFFTASKSLYEYNSDWLVREQCRAREDFECHERTMQKRLAEQEAALAEQEEALAKQEEALAKQEAALAEKEKTIAEQSNMIAEKELRIQELESLLKNQKS